MSFDRAIAFVLEWEGGDKVTHDPIDPGGTTKYGLSQRAYPDLNIESLTLEQATEIYQRDYWLKGRCDSLKEPLDLVHMDACVNCGRVHAAKFLQRAAGVEDDGEIGVNTLAAIALLDVTELTRHAILERERYYRQLADSRPALQRYLNGWLNRTAALKEVST